MRHFMIDYRRLVGPSSPIRVAQMIRLIVKYHGLQALLGYRLGRQLLATRTQPQWWILQPPGWLMYFLISRYVQLAFDIRLDLSADIGPGLYIGHFGDIHIRQCRIGKTCSVAQSVHIESADGVQHPVIGDRVWIGGHARIVGPYVIGNDSTIGAGAVIQRDVPARALFMGSPARLVIRDYDNSIILGISPAGANEARA